VNLLVNDRIIHENSFSQHYCYSISWTLL